MALPQYMSKEHGRRVAWRRSAHLELKELLMDTHITHTCRKKAFLSAARDEEVAEERRRWKM